MPTVWRDLAHVLDTLTMFLNTGPETADGEKLGDLEALQNFIRERTVSEVAHPNEADFPGLYALRSQLRAFLVAPEEDRINMANVLLSRASITPRLVDHDDLALHLHYFPPYAPLTEHLMADFSMALAQLLISGEGARLRICARPGCGRVMFDTTKNRSRIYCDGGTCGSRLHTAAYRARRNQKMSTISE
jgi:predicted RNA-binding Zn ribbon-like protein